MRNLLLFLSVLISLSLGVFAYLGLSSQISVTFYIILTLLISIFLTFAAGHGFSEMLTAKKELKQLKTASDKAHAEEINRLNAKIASLEAQLQTNTSANHEQPTA